MSTFKYVEYTIPQSFLLLFYGSYSYIETLFCSQQNCYPLLVNGNKGLYLLFQPPFGVEISCYKAHLRVVTSDSLWTDIELLAPRLNQRACFTRKEDASIFSGICCSIVLFIYKCASYFVFRPIRFASVQRTAILHLKMRC